MQDKVDKLRKYTILFVEDEMDIVEVFSDTLKKLKVDFFIANNGEEALKIYNKTPNINMVITDINMPIMNGFDLIRSIRNNDDNVLCFILSAEISEKTKEQAKLLNISEYIEKPFDFIKFISLFDRF